MFAALLERCLSRKMAAIVRMVTRKGASVSWAALIPQREELDDKNCQTTPPGFIACHLPFAGKSVSGFSHHLKMKLHEKARNISTLSSVRFWVCS